MPPSQMAIRSWCLDIAGQVRALFPEAAAAYGDPARLEHYIRAAQIFEGTFPEHRALLQAAFLHGIWDVSRLAQLGDVVCGGVREILIERKRVRALVKRDESVPQHLVREILPGLEHPEAALLLVVEQLLHLDSDERFADFTRRFHLTPEYPPKPVPLEPLGFDQLESQIDFLRLVVIPTAEFLGLWFYRNLAEDLYLYYADEERFAELCQVALDAIDKHEPDVPIALVRRELEGVAKVDVSWHWHHVASLDGRLPKGAHDSAAARLSHCGMVNVLCETAQDCYSAIGRLHLSAAFQHQRRDLEDSIGNPTASGYEAFHTLVKPVGEPAIPAIRVRVTPRHSYGLSLQCLSRRTLDWMKDQRRDERPGHQAKMVQVFANDGRSVALKPSSTVLNFAYAVHGDFVALAVRAFVNGDPTDLLHPLKTGDVVRLEIGTEPRALPPGWEKSVPADTIESIRKAHRRRYRPSLVSAGRHVVRSRLAALHVKGAEDRGRYDDQVLDTFLEESIVAVSRAEAVPRPILDVAWWLREFAPPEKDAAPISAGSRTVDAMLTRILDEAATRMKGSSKVGIEGITVPPKLRGTFDQWLLCQECGPLLGQMVVGRVQDRRLHIHRAGASCATGCTPVRWTRLYTRGQYFTIEMANRHGIAAEVISTFSRAGVEIIDLASGNLGPNWGALRVHVQQPGIQLSSRIAQELACIDGVVRVVRPDQEPVVVLEGVLPPRESARPLFFTQSSPFVCGPPLMEDQYFYGRGSELGELRRLFQQTRSPGASRGLMAWVKGPFKTGKTSLVERFVREIRRTEYQATVISLTATALETWRSLDGRIRTPLLEVLRESPRAGADVDRTAGERPLGQLISDFRTTTGRSLVLVVDEAVALFLSAADEPAIVNFMTWVASSPGVLVIWVGPEAPVTFLSDALRANLRAAHPIDVRGLEPLDFKYLLEAANMRDRGLSIKVEKRMFREVFRYTRGNPYWGNLLAEKLFHKEAGRTGQLCFRMSEFKAATQALIEQRLPFSDRVEDLSPETGLKGLIPVLLAALADHQKSCERGLTFDELLRAVRKSAGASLSPERIDWFLELLRARGSVRRANDPHATWEIDSPALLEHIWESYLDAWKPALT